MSAASSMVCPPTVGLMRAARLLRNLGQSPFLGPRLITPRRAALLRFGPATSSYETQALLVAVSRLPVHAGREPDRPIPVARYRAERDSHAFNGRRLLPDIQQGPTRCMAGRDQAAPERPPIEAPRLTRALLVGLVGPCPDPLPGLSQTRHEVYPRHPAQGLADSTDVQDT